MASAQDALRRYGGMYGQAKRNNKVLAEVVTVTATTEIARINVPLVGQTKQGYKPGRETREGTMTIQKIDTHWELEIYQYMSQTLVARRAARNANTNANAQSSRLFDLTISIDDPDAYGEEAWLLQGCQIWRLPLGFSITEDLINREFPLTWEDESPTSAFVATSDKDGAVTISAYSSQNQTVPSF